MPNYCSNTLTMTAISNKAKKLLKEYYALVEEETYPEVLFQHFYPRPDMEDESIREWNCENWGTKWDADDCSLEFEFELAGTNPKFIAEFQTAWSPPVAFYENMKEVGFSIEATYNEPGMEFLGKWDNDNGEVTLDYDEVELSTMARQVCDAWHDNYSSRFNVTPIELEPDAKKGDLVSKSDGSVWGLLLDKGERATHTELFMDAMESQGAFIELNWRWLDAIEDGFKEWLEGREPFYQKITYLATGETRPYDAVIINNKTAVII